MDLTREQIELERKRFEERIFARYFLSTIKRNDKVPQPRIAGCLDFVSTANMTQAEFCRRDENGRYAEVGVEPAWWAWQEAIKTYAEHRVEGDEALAALRARAEGEAVGEDDVEWVVNDIAELGVKVGGRFFWLYKGHSLVYGKDDDNVRNGIVQHDEGGDMHWRPVGKREFGECCHPVNYKEPGKWGTVSLSDSDEWKPLPAYAHPAPAGMRLVPEEELRALLREHYLWRIDCEHSGRDGDKGRDMPICACSRVGLGWHNSVGEAVEAWIDHVLAAAPEAK